MNGEQILLSELASQSKQEIFDILNTAYEIKSRVLAGLIKQKLLEDAAKKEKRRERNTIFSCLCAN